ncbi:hypothetical protein RCO48_16055, partial [Peribacillus frigoritolerans]|nr:hypothetical protein [Peribacillus frigoritolerans]
LSSEISGQNLMAFLALFPFLLPYLIPPCYIKRLNWQRFQNKKNPEFTLGEYVYTRRPLFYNIKPSFGILIKKIKKIIPIIL